MSERILVVHIAAIGDAAVASTVIERLRTERPDADVTWVCGEVSAPVVSLFDGIARVITVDQTRLFNQGPAARSSVILGLWRELLARRYDRAFILHPDPRYRILVAPLVGTTKAFLSRGRHGTMNPIPGRFHGDEYARLLDGNEHVGPIARRYAMSDLRAKFPAPAPRTRRRVTLVPGGAKNILRESAVRRWPLPHYVDVARAMIGAGHDVSLIGNASDLWVREAFEGLSVDDRIGALSLPETLRLLTETDLVISHDTGPIHLARLVRTPLIGLFGPTIPEEMLSIDGSVTVLWGGAELACRPCYDGREFARCADNICLSRVMPELVIDTARRRLAEMD